MMEQSGAEAAAETGAGANATNSPQRCHGPARKLGHDDEAAAMPRTNGNEDRTMTTDIRAAQPRQRVRSTSNFHAPAALDAYGRHFSRIGIASVAAAAAQVRPEAEDKGERAASPMIARLLRLDDDAA